VAGLRLAWLPWTWALALSGIGDALGSDAVCSASLMWTGGWADERDAVVADRSSNYISVATLLGPRTMPMAGIGVMPTTISRWGS